MKGFQALGILLYLAVLFVPAVAAASFGLYSAFWERGSGRVPKAVVGLLAAVLILMLMLKVFSTAPAYDFIDYCHFQAPRCAMVGPLRDEAEAELRRLMVGNYLRIVMLPVAAMTGLVLFVVRPRPRPGEKQQDSP